YVSLAAPGVDVPSTAWGGAGRGQYASQSGTSIAAPHVSGAAAILWGLRPDLAAADIAAALRASADKVGSADSGYGSGILNVALALQNPNAVPTTAHFLFVTPEGKQSPFDMRLDPNSRMTLRATDVMPNAEFATIVSTDVPVYVERSMYFGHDGHSAAGARQT